MTAVPFIDWALHGFYCTNYKLHPRGALPGKQQISRLSLILTHLIFVPHTMRSDKLGEDVTQTSRVSSDRPMHRRN